MADAAPSSRRGRRGVPSRRERAAARRGSKGGRSFRDSRPEAPQPREETRVCPQNLAALMQQTGRDCPGARRAEGPRDQSGDGAGRAGCSSIFPTTNFEAVGRGFESLQARPQVPERRTQNREREPKAGSRRPQTVRNCHGSLRVAAALCSRLDRSGRPLK